MTPLDPITLEILTEVLISIVREMRATVFRTARSVAIYEAKDFSCGLFDHTSEVIAQSEDIGAHVVPLPWSVQSAMKAALASSRSRRRASRAVPFASRAATWVSSAAGSLSGTSPG